MVINLSQTYTLSTTEERVLEKGLSFIPTVGPGLPNQLETEAQITEYHRRLKITYFGTNNTEEQPAKAPFTNKSGWEPPPKKNPSETQGPHPNR
ncbi:uncharacterized protein LOC109201125 isoform X1 [Tachysurus ichikawai]